MLQTLSMLPCRRSRVMRLGLVVMDLDRRLVPIEGALDGWVRVMMRESVTITRIARLPVGVASGFSPESRKSIEASLRRETELTRKWPPR